MIRTRVLVHGTDWYNCIRVYHFLAIETAPPTLTVMAARRASSALTLAADAASPTAVAATAALAASCRQPWASVGGEEREVEEGTHGSLDLTLSSSVVGRFLRKDTSVGIISTEIRGCSSDGRGSSSIRSGSGLSMFEVSTSLLGLILIERGDSQQLPHAPSWPSPCVPVRTSSLRAYQTSKCRGERVQSLRGRERQARWR